MSQLTRRPNNDSFTTRQLRQDYPGLNLKEEMDGELALRQRDQSLPDQLTDAAEPQARP
jgi:hypothetical protein